ncbi:hypothetical protein [Solidesulfovibrio magneticus]|uniref:Zinc resistance-associated protein n=1 Tax=Solidesulfovibrio magneticus (strain ATCC 700980 / DSM 13731 / RS-1) TaxID=573370 RepID=C4XL75_SOLM1|nr:hypothetical protein [Solidesulfovibrio magneticus]BAH77016.1 hypothetical protein DMR_35250 [Solidesulfovibrio magneticus RS-1]
MRINVFAPAALAAAMLLSLPAIGLTAQEHGGHAADPAKPAAPAPAVDPDKAYLLKQEFTAKTAELRGKIKAREADLEILLATKPGDEAAVKKLAGDLAALRGQLAEQTVLFRLRYAKETGTPIRQTLHLGGGHEGMMAGMGEGGMDCKMMGKDKGQGMGMMMGGMDHGAKEHGPATAPASAAPTPPVPAAKQ